MNDKGRDFLWIVICGATVTLMLRPFQNTPFIDDWAYAWSVEQLLQRGQIRLLDWSVHPNFAQILWGWIFCLPTGFSFVALRASTFVLALTGLCAFYMLLRDLNVSRRDALMGVAVLGFNPVFFVLSFTFMTDIPFLAATIVAAWAFVRALRERSDWWLAAAAVLGIAAICVRWVGLVLPLAMLMALLLQWGDWGRRAHRVMIAMLPLGLAVLLLLLRPGLIEHVADLSLIKDSAVNRFDNLRFALPLLPRMIVWVVAFVSLSVGVMLLPLTLASDWRSSWRRWMLAMAVVAGCVLVAWLTDAKDFLPLNEGSTWAWNELGAAKPLIPGYEAPTVEPWWLWLLGGVGMASCACAAVVAGSRRRKEANADPVAASSSVCAETCGFFTWLLAGFLLLLALLWLLYDRYYLPLLPPVIALLLMRGSIHRTKLATAGIACLAAISLVGTYDHLQLNRALWGAVEHLRQRGAGDSDINGGYVVNGWLQYAHPKNAPRDSRGLIAVAGVISNETTSRYRICLRPLQDWKRLATYPARRWFGGADMIYVLEHTAVTRVSPAAKAKGTSP